MPARKPFTIFKDFLNIEDEGATWYKKTQKGFWLYVLMTPYAAVTQITNLELNYVEIWMGTSLKPEYSHTELRKFISDIYDIGKEHILVLDDGQSLHKRVYVNYPLAERKIKDLLQNGLMKRFNWYSPNPYPPMEGREEKLLKFMKTFGTFK
ncbi:hypothetical protein ENBRE01_0684 [Enteropsectra breve]|nr:hypothetical protein ENBRE01_0684 [Enteropsectra breve]